MESWVKVSADGAVGKSSEVAITMEVTLRGPAIFPPSVADPEEAKSTGNGGREVAITMEVTMRGPTIFFSFGC
jgi:hypothetical protein